MRAWVPVVAVLVLAGACSAETAEEARPSTPSSAASSAAPAGEWAEPESYRYVLTTGCTRGFTDARYRVEVDGGRVLSTSALNDQARSRPDFVAPTLGEIDAWMRAATGDERRDRDPVDGRPVAFGFDPEAMAIDAGRCYAVSEYAPAG